MSDFAPMTDSTRDMDEWAPKRTLTLAAARRHSKRVRYFQIGLLVAAGVLLAILTFEFSTRSQTEIFSQEVDETIRMVNPRYIGRTADGLPYTLTANEAGRVRNAPNELNLVRPLLNFYRVKGAEASTIDAISGVYNDVDQVLNLRADVVLTTDDGNRCETTHARILLEEKIVQGDEFIRCTGAFGIVEGNAYEIRDNYNTFVFFNGMSGLLEPDSDDERAEATSGTNGDSEG